MRIPADKATRAYYQRAAPGEHATLGDFLCKLTTRFGPADPYVYLFYDQFPVLAFPLQHVATGTVFVPFPKSHGYAEFDTDKLEPIAAELDALLAATEPDDCEYTFSGWYRVDHAGVRDGKPFFEHVGFAATLDMRLAQFAENDAHGGDRKDDVEEDLCHVTLQNWSERKREGQRFADEFPTYPRREEVHARLVQCLHTTVDELEQDAADDSFDAGAAPEDAKAAWAAYKELELDDASLAGRIQRLRARFKRGHLR